MAHATTIIDAEAGRFDAMAGDWWDPRGSSGPLHKLNPPRLRFIRDCIDRHWGTAHDERRPLAGRTALDIGCGAGLLAEPLARLGAAVTGIDAAANAIRVAQAHAASVGLSIDYRVGEAAALGNRYDLVTALEVIEHVADPAAFVRDVAARVAPGGLAILSTPNRTWLSRLAVITLGESIGGIPKGTHDHDRFVTPAELAPMLAAAGLEEIARSGIVVAPATGFVLSTNERLNYIVAATPDAGQAHPARP